MAIVDAYDLLFAGPPEELEKKFLSMSSPIVAGGEDMCILNCHKHSCKVNNERYRWVNGGCIIGRVQALIEAYVYTLQVSPEDDQIGIAKYMDENPSKVTIDGNQMIVANVRSTEELNCIANGRFQHTETQHIPVIIHTPFMYSDLGARSEMTRKHAIENYQSLSFGTYTTGLISHLYKHVTKNPAYSSILYGVIALIVTLVVFLIWRNTK